MRVLLVLLLASATSSGSITSTLLERAARENYSTQKKFIRERKNKAGNQSKRRNAPKCVEDDVDHGCDRRPNRRNRRLVLCSYRTRRSLTRPFIYIYICGVQVVWFLSESCLCAGRRNILKIWEKCSCHVILCRGRRTVGQGIINVLYQWYITREREREKEWDKTFLSSFIMQGSTRSCLRPCITSFSILGKHLPNHTVSNPKSLRFRLYLELFSNRFE